MIILGIETSCDETAIAVVEVKGKSLKILSNIVSSQVKIHAKFGGVVPNLAKREHQKNLPRVLKLALKKAKINLPKVDLIAVTHGPGLEPALWTGVNFAKALSYAWDKPIIGIDHMEGHLAAILLQQNSSENSKSKKQNSKLKIKFPILALLVSGGHTQLVLVKKFRNYKIIGETRDDAAGEAFDKVARMLGLGFPGGPAIAAQAAKFQMSNVKCQLFKLPRPMINSPDYDFSFSGLKTAVLYKLKELGIMNEELKIQICHEFQQAIVDVLIKKTLKAAQNYKVKTILLGGGVAANNSLRNCLKSKINFFVPPKNLCTDNAAMIAAAASFHSKKDWQKCDQIEVNANLRLS